MAGAVRREVTTNIDIHVANTRNSTTNTCIMDDTETSMELWPMNDLVSMGTSPLLQCQQLQCWQ